MNKLNKQTVYLPIDVNVELPPTHCSIYGLDGGVILPETIKFREDKSVYVDRYDENFEYIDYIEREIPTHWLKKEEKYVLSENEMSELLSNVFRAGNRRGYSGYPNTDNWTQPTEEQYINKILNNEAN